jgi:hypothetical protein
MGVPEGFRYSVSKAGTVAFTHHGRPAGMLRGKVAAAFLAFAEGLEEDSEELQQRMARLTGNYKRGNERGRREQRHARRQGDFGPRMSTRVSRL